MSTAGFDFAVIGINHGHIYGQVEAMLGAGCRLTKFFAPEDDLAAAFSGKFPQATRVASEAEILEDPQVLLVAGAGIPAERAPMALRAMGAGKDVMLDKPGCVSVAQLDELRAVQAQTGRICSILYSEHYRQKSTVRAMELVRAGAIGRVFHTIGLGPHQIGNFPRPDWFWDPNRNGSILTDIAAHQFEQFLSFTSSSDGRILHSVEENFDHPQRPDFRDYGHAVVASAHATGFIRVDWFTPDGSPVWGDGRLFVMGTEGTIELRKYMDIQGRPGGDHLFLTDRTGTHYVDCADTQLSYGARLRDDVLNRSDTAMSQAHCFLAMELALEAHTQAQRLAGQRPGTTDS